MATNTMTRNERRTLSAGTLIGDPVTNPQGEKVGDLKEIMLDVHTGRVAYGVLDFGGIAGMGNKLFAVPFERFTVDEKDHKLILDVDTEILKNAEGFDKNNWPDTTDPAWIERTHNYYGVSPYYERR